MAAVFTVLYLLLSLYLSIQDIRHGTVSRTLLLLSLAAALGVRVLLRGPAVLPAAAGGAALGLGLFLLAFFWSRKKLGLADVWYAGLIGVVLGPLWWFGGIMLACLLALVFCLFSGRRSVPFIPFMAAGSAAALAWSGIP